MGMLLPMWQLKVQVSHILPLSGVAFHVPVDGVHAIAAADVRSREWPFRFQQERSERETGWTEPVSGGEMDLARTHAPMHTVTVAGLVACTDGLNLAAGPAP